MIIADFEAWKHAEQNGLFGVPESSSRNRWIIETH